MKETYFRAYQMVHKQALKVMKWRKPVLIEGENALLRLPQIITDNDIKRVLIVTDKGIVKAGLMKHLLVAFDKVGIEYTIYQDTVPNPTIDNIEDALALYKAQRCQGIIAFGGGSPMDCAKGVGARVARPNKTIEQLKGQLKVNKAIPPLFAIPTTAGTGSETTLAAVVSNSRTHEKYALMDLSLIPHFAVLDPVLTLNLPKHITATTGMDALTHAIEAYIGRSNTSETKMCSEEAVRLIFSNLLTAYEDGQNIAARKNMQKASFLAGVAFTRAFVGYVHAIAHTLGGFYKTPHGLANAVILPYVLEYYGDAVYDQLAKLSDVIGLSNKEYSNEAKAKQLISKIRELNAKMGIPEKIEGIEEKDIPLMVERAYREANPLYPVPKILDKHQLTELYYLIKE
ncbi:iron-containing alcohol dehydrogenase [Metasolibacillus fluoroglycofenilyticus]|uniref:iron-containing alcohol dehydrogenase n=1 Tax=Metasolibacillus fluoroglycofenilyticus TaxID=1239396 RepID=UPI000D3D50E4|nr:iron-containing alcohol dehydrogenase [Metasolibacillus fluoroglycofenilyticus]